MPRFLLTIVLVLTISVSWADGASIFMYHRFGETQFPATNVRLDAFQAQLELLRESAQPVIPLAQVISFLRKGEPLPEMAVAITVDDAYLSVYEHAWPMLKSFGFPLTVFVATDPLDRGFAGSMSWDQAREMAAEGVTFASHGAAHLHLVRRLAGESEADWRIRIASDIDKAGQRLAEELGASGQVLEGIFAYPYGEYDAALARLLRERNMMAFGQQSGPVGAVSDPLALPRFPINEAYSELETFRTKAQSRPMPVIRIEPWDPVTNRLASLDFWLDPAAGSLSRLTCFVSGQGRLQPEQVNEWHFRVVPEQPLGRGRQRVNCTAPGEDGRYFWWSHQWVVR